MFGYGYLETLYNTTPSGTTTPSFQVQRQVLTFLNNYGLGSLLLGDLNGDSRVDLVGSYNQSLAVSIQR